MPLHLRIAMGLCVFGVVGATVSLIAPKRPAAASGTAVALSAGADLTCRRVVKVGPLGFGARCVASGVPGGRIASSGSGD